MSETQERSTASKLVTKIISPTINTVISFAGGLIGSAFNPFTMPHTLENLSDPEKRERIGLTNSIALITGYYAGLGAITYNIVENPRSPSSYIPLATNALSFLYFKYRGKEQE